MKLLIITVVTFLTAGAWAAGPMCHPTKPPFYLLQGYAEWQQLYGSLNEPVQ